MAVYDTYSKRLKRASGDEPDVYRYDNIPKTLRNQICQIMDDALGDYVAFVSSPDVRSFYDRIVNTLRRERGEFVLPPSKNIKTISDRYHCDHPDTRSELRFHVLDVPHHDSVLDAVELICQRIIAMRKVQFYAERNEYENDEISSGAIAELNIRFQEHGIGYRFESNKIIKIDSEHVHQNVTKPALAILQAPEYKTANDEYLNAFDHYRNGKYPECLNESLKAFESVMKVICSKRGWKHAKSATASTLVQTCIRNGLVPSMLENKMNNLIELLSSSVPTVRNQTAGHGGGTEKIDIPQHLARYVLDMTGSAIVFLANAESELTTS